MRILVLYYSRTGTTRAVAESVASSLSADLEEVTEPQSRKGLLGYLRSGFQAFRRIVVPLNPLVHEVAAYDLVVIGTPVWAGRLSSPVLSLVRLHGADMASVAWFCTCGGSGDKARDEILRELGAKVIATAVFREKDVKNGTAADGIATFAQSLGAV
ncbi:MAG: flavodoxin domain-containing protein [Candidatus Methanofastidiosa archaeon]|nr:flavodoxin domain-containing protein [Candidatus Methanofastidiosa archaeon]